MDESFDESFIDGLFVTCPRCEHRSPAREVWIWTVDSNALRLPSNRQVDSGSASLHQDRQFDSPGDVPALSPGTHSDSESADDEQDGSIPGSAQAVRLTDLVVRGEIRPPADGRKVIAFDLACGCRFALFGPQAWNLHVQTSVTMHSGGSIQIVVRRRH